MPEVRAATCPARYPREHTVAPRLKAAGADMSLVLFVDVETETSTSGTVTLPFDNGADARVGDI